MTRIELENRVWLLASHEKNSTLASMWISDAVDVDMWVMKYD